MTPEIRPAARAWVCRVAGLPVEHREPIDDCRLVKNHVSLFPDGFGGQTDWFRAFVCSRGRGQARLSLRGTRLASLDAVAGWRFQRTTADRPNGDEAPREAANQTATVPMECLTA